jgi:hypothetical protein
MIERIAALPCELLIALVRAYRLLLSPWLGSNCRFEPTCSQYALTALEHHGAAAGGALAAGRLLRCHPWCAGGHDPVPDESPALFARLGLGRRGGAPVEPDPTEPEARTTP